MKSNTFKLAALLLLVSSSLFFACQKDDLTDPTTDGASEHTKTEQSNLDNFDILDFDGWNKSNWTIFDNLHDVNVKVVDTDGTVINGQKAHNEQAKGAQATFPSIISEHPIKLADGEWTAVSGTIEFKLPNGAVVKNRMVTLAHWKNGKIIEEQLFFDKP